MDKLNLIGFFPIEAAQEENVNQYAVRELGRQAIMFDSEDMVIKMDMDAPTDATSKRTLEVLIEASSAAAIPCPWNKRRKGGA